MSINTITRFRSAITMMVLLALFTALLPAHSILAQEPKVALTPEQTRELFFQWTTQESERNDFRRLPIEQAIFGNLIGNLIHTRPLEEVKELFVEMEGHYYKQFGQRGTDLQYRKGLPTRTLVRNIFAAALQTPYFNDGVEHTYRSLKDQIDSGYVIVSLSSNRALNKALEDGRIVDEARALFKETTSNALKRAETDKEFAKNLDAFFEFFTGVKPSEVDPKQIANDPNSSVPQPMRDAIKPDGSMEISVAELDKLTREALDNINASIDDTQKTIGTIAKEQEDLVDAANDPAARLKAQAIAEAKYIENQRKLGAASSAISIISTLVSFSNPERGKQISVVGQSAIQVGEALNGWMLATAGLSTLNKIGSLSTVVMTANVLGAVMNVVSLFGPQQPPPEQIILEEIGKLRQQVNELRTEMHTRFDQIDKELNTIYTTMNDRFNQVDIKLGKITTSLEEIQQSLLTLGIQLDRMERNNTEYLDTLGRRPLREAMNGALNYKQRTGLDMPYQPEFVEYENTLHTWGTVNAFDALSAGPTQRDYSDGQVLAELSAAPLDANVNYLNGWLQAHGMQPFATKRLASPRDWAFASRAYAELGMDWPEHLKRIDPQRQAALDAVGKDLEQALLNISTIQTADGPQGNAPLWNGLADYYKAKLAGVDNSLVASEAAYVGDVARSLGRSVPFELYGGLDQTLPYPYRPDSFHTITCGTEGIPQAGIATPRHLKNMVSNYDRFALADYLQVSPLKVCVYASFANLDPPCPDYMPSCDRYGNPRVAVIVYSDTVELVRFVLDGIRTKFDPNIWNVIGPEWETYWNRRMEPFFLTQTTPPPLSPLAVKQLETVSSGLAGKLAEHQRAHVGRVLNELNTGPLRASAIELAGAKKLLESFITLGFPRAIESDDLLRSLLFSRESLVDDQQIGATYASLPPATQPISEAQLLVNPRTKLLETGQKRHDALRGLLTDYLGGISTDNYREDNALISSTRFDIVLARVFADPNAPLPGQSRVIFLPFVQR